MTGRTSVLVAAIGAIAAISGAFFTASATSATRVNEVSTEVQVLKRTQELQYSELKTSVQVIQSDVKEILKAVK